MKNLSEALSEVSDTLFIPLICRANETQSKDPIIQDQKAVDIIQSFKEILAQSNKPHLRELINHKYPQLANVSMALRSRAFDRYVLDFLEHYPQATIVNLACGLDSRFERIDNGKVNWYDLDLPPVIAIREEFFSNSDRYHMLAKSALEFDWLDMIEYQKSHQVMILAEGFFMYLRPEYVKALVTNIKNKFPGCHLVFENTHGKWVDKMQKGLMRKMFQFKMQNQLKMGKNVLFHFGLRSGKEMEKWDKDIKFLDEWTYFDDKEPKMSVFNLFGKFKTLAKTQWVLHYQLGKKSE